MLSCISDRLGYRDNLHKGSILFTQETILHVSSEWRAIGLNTPSLWSNIYIQSWLTVIRLSLWLSRSVGSPLNIFVPPAPVGTVVGPTYYGHVRNLVVTATEHIQRWQSLTLHVLHPSDACRVLDPFLYAGAGHTGTHPLMRDLTVTCSHPSHGEPIWNRTATSFMQWRAPNLSSISLSGFHLPWRVPVFTILTELELDLLHDPPSPSLYELKTLLYTAQALTTLTLKFSRGHAFPSANASTSVVLSHTVTELAIQFHNHNGAFIIIPYLAFPVLKTFHLTVKGWCLPSAFMHCIQNSDLNIDNLTGLYIHGFDGIAPITDRPILAPFTRLNYLHFDSAGILHDFVHSTIVGSLSLAVPVLCPDLSTISFEGTPFAEARAIVKARMSINRRLTLLFRHRLGERMNWGREVDHVTWLYRTAMMHIPHVPN